MSAETEDDHLEYGNEEISPTDLENRNGRFRISLFIDLDVIEALKEKAKTENKDIRTLINDTLKKQLLSPLDI